jgi:solute carrier family 25 folate transporter 32
MTSTRRPLAALYRGLTPNLVGNATGWASFFFFKARADALLAAWRASPSQSGSLARPSSGPDASAAPSPIDYLLSPALAGAATTALTNPVWVIKTRMLSSDRGAAGAYPSMAAGVRSIYRNEGLAGFYRGLGVSLIGVSHGAVQFAVYEPAKRAYRQHYRSRDGDERGLDDAPLGTEATMLLSSGAKLVAGAVTYPYQVLRSRLQNYQADERFGRGFSGVVRKTWSEEGVRGFYRGLVPGVIRVMPATWVTFLVYENVKYYLPRMIS